MFRGQSPRPRRSESGAGAFDRLEQTWRDVLAHSANPSAFHTWRIRHEWRRRRPARIGGATGEYKRWSPGRHGRPSDRGWGTTWAGGKDTAASSAHSLAPMTDSPVAIYGRVRRSVSLRCGRTIRTRERGTSRPCAPSAPGCVLHPARVLSGFANAVEVNRRFAMVPSAVRASGAIVGRVPEHALRSRCGQRRRITRGSFRASGAAGPFERSARPAEIGAATDNLIDLHRMRSAAGWRPHSNHIATDSQAKFLRFGSDGLPNATDRNLDVGGRRQVVAGGVPRESGCVAVYFRLRRARLPLQPAPQSSPRGNRARMGGTGRVEYRSSQPWKHSMGDPGATMAETSLYSTGRRAGPWPLATALFSRRPGAQQSPVAAQ